MGNRAIVRELKNCGPSIADRYGTIRRSTRGQSISRWYSSLSFHLTASEPGKSAESASLSAAVLIDMVVEKYGIAHDESL